MMWAELDQQEKLDAAWESLDAHCGTCQWYGDKACLSPEVLAKANKALGSIFHIPTGKPAIESLEMCNQIEGCDHWEASDAALNNALGVYDE